VRDVLERQIQTIRYDLTESDCYDVERDETTTKGSRSEFSNVETGDGRGSVSNELRKSHREKD
jgi:hypothetical protein